MTVVASPILDITREIGHVRNQKEANWHAIAFQKIQSAVQGVQSPPLQTYTPTVTAGTGLFAANGVSATGRYRQIGKLIFIQIAIVITTNGTAATNVIATLPFASVNVAGVSHVLTGRADGMSGKQLQGVIHPNSSQVSILNYDNSYPGASGETLVLSGFYEIN